MKLLALPFLCLLVTMASCQQPEENTNASQQGETKSIVDAPCSFSDTDSTLVRQRLRGEWELAGIKTNAMGTKPDEFLTGEKIGTPKTLRFYPNNEFEISVNGRAEGGRQKYVLDGQSMTPLAYQFWFCGANTLVLSNIMADGPTEVYIKK